MIYLKTLFSSPYEIKFLKLSLRESSGYIDKFIICEFDHTHTGLKKPLIFKNYLESFTTQEKKKIVYLGVTTLDDFLLAGDNEKLAHRNELLMRGYFVKQVGLNRNDIIISLDADEIIYRQNYNDIFNRLGLFTKAVTVPLYQFFYKINYLWENNKFIAPTICFADYYKNKFPAPWRYEGKIYSDIVGGHFSWCLSIADMIKKIKNYAHSQKYIHLAKKDVLESAVKNKTYPFDPKVNFQIKVLNIYRDVKYYPKSLYDLLPEFTDLIAEI
jgi:hypothetical protein